MASDDVIVINEGYELRTSKTGKTRATIVVRSEPLVHNLDPKALGKPVAAAIVAHLRARIQGIAEQASAATLKYREKMRKEFAEGKPDALRRYSGGKTGAMPPGQSTAAFNDSGRFAKTLTANGSSDGAWRVNVAANRMTDKDSGGVARIYQKLVSLVPEFANPAQLLTSDFVRKAIDDSMKVMITKQRASSSALAIELVRSVLELAKQVGEFGDLLSDAA